MREGTRGTTGDVDSVSLVTSYDGRARSGWAGEVVWSHFPSSGDRGLLLAIQGIPTPRSANADATNTDAVTLVIRSSGGAQRPSVSSLALWARAYDPQTPLLVDPAPVGAVVRVTSRSSDGAVLPNVQLLTMPVGIAIGGEQWEQEETVTDSAGAAEVLAPRPGAGVLVMARSDDGRMGRTLVGAGDTRADVMLTAGEVLSTTIRLYDGRSPASGDAYLVTRPFSRWTVPCAWDAASARFTSVRPVLLELFDIRMDASSFEQTGSSPLDRKERRYRLAMPAKDAQRKTVELPRLDPHAFDVK
jgi:hypothetical protein